MGNVTRRERICGTCGVPHRGDRASCNRCVHAARKARGGYPTVACVGCGKSMYKSRTTAVEPLCGECRRSRRDKWKREGRPCATCGRVTRRWQHAKCIACEVAHREAVCDVHRCERPALAKGLCSSHYAYQWRTAEGQSLNGRGTWIEPKRRLQIYERDNWTCAICDEPIDREAPVNEGRAPSLDHIVPRSLGGGHESSNLRTAHRDCNAGRGARV